MVARNLAESPYGRRRCGYSIATARSLSKNRIVTATKKAMFLVSSLFPVGAIRAGVAPDSCIRAPYFYARLLVGDGKINL